MLKLINEICKEEAVDNLKVHISIKLQNTSQNTSL